jgi:hypothetical protein
MKTAQDETAHDVGPNVRRKMASVDSCKGRFHREAFWSGAVLRRFFGAEGRSAGKRTRTPDCDAESVATGSLERLPYVGGYGVIDRFFGRDRPGRGCLNRAEQWDGNSLRAADAIRRVAH